MINQEDEFWSSLHWLKWQMCFYESPTALSVVIN